MSGDNLDALGQIAEGALLGAAVEPAHGNEPKDAADADHLDAATCPNCGAAVAGNFCSQCGQKAHLHRTLTAFWHDLLHGALHFDGKMWRTLPLLAFKPGKLTRRYIDGERASFVSPMALFLFSIFLMFAVFQMLGITAPTNLKTADGLGTDLSTARSTVAERVQTFEEELQADDLSQQEQEDTRRELSEAADSLSRISQAQELIDKDEAEDGAKANLTGIEFIDQGIIKKWRENPSLMIYKLQANSYKFSWALIPLSIPFVWLLFFWRREFKAYDHAIFVTYSLAFMSLLFVVISSLAFAGIHEAVIVLSALFIPPIHIYKQLRKTYGLSRIGAFLRLYVLLHLITLVVVLFLQLLLVLGAF